jgi:hypothetical protein
MAWHSLRPEQKLAHHAKEAKHQELSISQISSLNGINELSIGKEPRYDDVTNGLV